MNKKGYCNICNMEIDFKINSLEDLNDAHCPKCNNKINLKMKESISSTSKPLSKRASKIYNFWYYFHFIFSIIGLVLFYFKMNTFGLIISIINLIVHMAESMIGLNRNYLGTIGLIICSIISIIITKNLTIGIGIGISITFIITSIIQFIINTIFNFLFKKLN